MMKTVGLLVRYEWYALWRRNLAGVISGVISLVAAPIVGFVCASSTHTLLDFGYDSASEYYTYLIMGSLTVLSFFPVIYAAFLVSDSVVLEKELGTLELVFWSPVTVWHILIGKLTVPLLFTKIIVVSLFALFSASYGVGARLLEVPLPFPWITVIVSFLLVSLILILSVVCGLFISSLADNAKMAATASLGLSGLLLIAEIGLGAYLVSIGMSIVQVISVVAIFTLISIVLVSARVANRLGERERYFLVGRGRETGASGLPDHKKN